MHFHAIHHREIGNAVSTGFLPSAPREALWCALHKGTAVGCWLQNPLFLPNMKDSRSLLPPPITRYSAFLVVLFSTHSFQTTDLKVSIPIKIISTRKIARYLTFILLFMWPYTIPLPFPFLFSMVVLFPHKSKMSLQ